MSNNKDAATYHPGPEPPAVTLHKIVEAWREPTTWDEFGRRVGAILALAGLDRLDHHDG